MDKQVTQLENQNDITLNIIISPPPIWLWLNPNTSWRRWIPLRYRHCYLICVFPFSLRYTSMSKNIVEALLFRLDDIHITHKQPHFIKSKPQKSWNQLCLLTIYGKTLVSLMELLAFPHKFAKMLCLCVRSSADLGISCYYIRYIYYIIYIL